MNPVTKMISAARELGLEKLWLYLRYQVGLRSGYYRLRTRKQPAKMDGSPPRRQHFITVPTIVKSDLELVLSAAEEVYQGSIRLFGGDSVPLDLGAGASNKHWTWHERHPVEGDPKLTWEPARFGWAITLARAYAFSKDPKYARVFWDKTLAFFTDHPPYNGPHWQSAQEAAIRLMVLIFCDCVLSSAPASTPENRRRLWHALADHALRIPPTLVYARAQNNNHLLSEAAGLYAAGLYLADHPQAKQWRETGWHWLNWGFQRQIKCGSYTQHSSNYHRLMLQLALFCDHLRRTAGEPKWPGLTLARLQAATRWLWALTDPETGHVPNLGANDGAYLFPLTSRPFEDYRPVVHAAARAFLDKDIYRDESVDEMAAWFNLDRPENRPDRQPQALDILRIDTDEGRAFLHTAHYRDRPSHADQLHADLWWHGVNIARDPGTYRYTAEPPWDNALAGTRFHNVLTINGRDQMQRAGRFLWVNWAQAEVLGYETDDEGHLTTIKAEQTGYRQIGLRHQRALSRHSKGWNIVDALVGLGNSTSKPYQVWLTWQLPDWDWSLDKADRIKVSGPDFSFKLRIKGADQLNLYRAGEKLLGDLPPEPTWGWYAPTYAVKIPALMLVAACTSAPPIKLQSKWRF